MRTERIRESHCDNRRKTITVCYTSGKQVTVRYEQLGISRVAEVWVDKETRGRSVGIRMTDGRIDYMPWDQPLALVRDAEYLVRSQMERLAAQLTAAIASRGVSKRYVGQKLEISASQIERLLDPTVVNKNLEQLYRIGALLGLELEWNVRKAA